MLRRGSSLWTSTISTSTSNLGLTIRPKNRNVCFILSPEKIAKATAFRLRRHKYYFDVDIRKHFGLDKYDSDVISYWKTETVEAMERCPKARLSKNRESFLSDALTPPPLLLSAAYHFRTNHIRLPLHSTNFIESETGSHNNRHLVTKQMWFKGTAISYKASGPA